MKELSVEEKAKAYDEAIERANSLLSDNQLGNAWIYKLLPELKKSEGEKIRKALIDFLEYYRLNNVLDSKTILLLTDSVAWLENQGEHANFRNKIQIGDKVTRNEDGVLVNLSQLNRVAKKDEKRGEQKIADKKGMNLVEEEMTPFQKKVFCIIDTTIEEEQGLKQVCDELLRLAHDEIMQTPAEWSEKDEENLNWFEKFFRAESVIAEGKDIPQDRYLWFKNLKDRIQPRTEQEWSKEDEERINHLCRFLDEYGEQYYGALTLDATIYWLKSLRDRYTWKPSIAQLNALSIVSKGSAPDDIEAIVSLYNDLKKLREN